MTQNDSLQKVKNFVHLLQSVYGNIRYGFPAKKLKILAITGSDGKTTSTMMLYHILQKSGIKVGYISTIGARIGDEELDTGLHVTTPDPWMVPKYLRMMVDQEIEYVVMEATSNGLEQNRLWGITFSGGLITNIKSDHLDYHKTWENYARAKFKLITQLSSGAPIVINKEDTKSYKWIKKEITRLNLKQDFNLIEVKLEDAKKAQFSLDGFSFFLDGQRFNLQLLGKYNLENALGVIALARHLLPLEVIAKSLESFRAPKGRMELVQTKPFTVIIDFAHTPNSLREALKSLKELKTRTQKLIVVFGCAGKRDKERRLMGTVASEFADIIILTAEDPRDEKLFDINTQIYENSKKTGGELVSRITNHKDYTNTKLSTLKTLIDTTLRAEKIPVITFDEDSVRSREDAIDLAIKLASKEDIVFTTGKAHEQSLAFGPEEKEYPWSEHNIVKKSLQSNQQIN